MFGILGQIEQPTNLVTLQWVIIVALVSVVIYIDKQREKDRDKVYEALAEVSEALNGLANVVEDWQSQQKVMNHVVGVLDEIQKLRQEIKHGKERPD